MESFNKGPLGPQGPQGVQGLPSVDTINQMILQLKGNTGSQMLNSYGINQLIQQLKNAGYSKEADKISDGWHTFEDLYEFRLLYNALAFNLLYNQDRLTHIFKNNTFVHKSWKHHDGEYCFGEEKKWFIVAAMLDDKPITNHYKAEHWNLFQIPEMERSIFEYDGHTAEDVIMRLRMYLSKAI